MMNEIIFDFDCTDHSQQPPGLSLANIFRNIIKTSIQEDMPEYIDSFPFLKGRNSEFILQNEIMIIKIDYDIHMNMVAFGSLKDSNLINKVNGVSELKEYISYDELKSVLGSEYLNYNTFTYFVRTNNGHISIQNFYECIISWLNNDVVPIILENNRKRIIDAIPIPPTFDINSIIQNIFVLEDEEALIQGTCFYLKNTGFITCYHILFDKNDIPFSNMYMFDHKNISLKYKINIVKSDKTLDIAIFELLKCDKIFDGLEQGTADNINQMDHIGVAGFPNYRLGDSGILSPGLIIGFRPNHGIRRLLVNAPIISGNSGGPILDRNNKVVGIAVTGADCMENSKKTDNHGAIPIDAINFLK